MCFPSHWRLADKLGRSVAEIHGPVPHYADELADKVDRFFDRLTVEHPVVRRNLSIHSHDELFRPEPHESPDSFAPDARGVDQVWLRSERQTLVVLPASGAVLFTIKTQQCPASALAARPDIAHALAAKLTALTPDLTATGEPIPFPPGSWTGSRASSPNASRSAPLPTPSEPSAEPERAAPMSAARDGGAGPKALGPEAAGGAGAHKPPSELASERGAPR